LIVTGAHFSGRARLRVKIWDRQILLAFYDLPAEHWDHLRTSNPIESVFSTVRHRTVRTKGSLSSATAKPMVFKLIMSASKTWRRLNSEKQLPKVVQGVRFRGGIEIIETPSKNAARSVHHPNFGIALMGR
jgi:putative transposase